MKIFKKHLKLGFAILLLMASSLALSQQQTTGTQKLNILMPTTNTNTLPDNNKIPSMFNTNMQSHPQEQLPPGNIPSAPPVTVTLVPNNNNQY